MLGSVRNVAKATTCHTQNKMAMYSPDHALKGNRGKIQQRAISEQQDTPAQKSSGLGYARTIE